MRLKKIAATATITLGTISAAVATPEAAHATVTSYCPGYQAAVYYGNDRAWNDYGGIIGEGHQIDFYQNIADNNSQWCVIYKGTVSDGTNGILWPFTDGSGMNTRYNGQPVYEFVLASTYNGTQYCSDGGNWNSGLSELDGENDLDTCSSPTHTYSQLYVQSSSDYLANVWANNAMYAVCVNKHLSCSSYLPQLVGDAYDFGNDTNGQPIFNDYNYQLQWNIDYDD